MKKRQSCLEQASVGEVHQKFSRKTPDENDASSRSRHNEGYFGLQAALHDASTGSETPVKPQERNF